MSRPKKQGSYTNPAFCQQSEFFDSRCKSPQRRQSPVGAQTVHILDTSIRSIQEEPLPPRPSTANSVRSHYEVEECDEEQEFYEEMIVDDRGAIQEKKFVVVHQQHQHIQGTPGRLDYIPLQKQQLQQQHAQNTTRGRSRVASPPKVLYHEEVDASTGRLHRYATIPTDDELDDDDDECEEAHEVEEHEIPPQQPQQQQQRQHFALVPVSEIKNNKRYAVITQEDIANASRPVTTMARPSPRLSPMPSPVRLYPQHVVPTSGPSIPTQIPVQLQRRPAPNPLATQKLHELLTTPKKNVPVSAMSPLSPISPIQPIRGSLRNTPPPRAQQKLNYTIGSRPLAKGATASQPVDKRHTAIVAPICSSPVQTVYHETTFTDKMDPDGVVCKSNPAQKTIAVAAFMMILCGAVTTGLSIYMISYLGRNYYLDFGILSGSICFMLGLLGFRSRQVYWLPNRNYISGYFVLSVFSLLTCCGLLVLLVTQPRPGTLLADMTSGAVCGISGLSLGLAAIGLLASYCCNVPPPDNRVQHCAPGFTV